MSGEQKRGKKKGERDNEKNSPGSGSSLSSKGSDLKSPGSGSSLSSHGYGVLKDSNPALIESLKKKLTVRPKVFNVLDNAAPVEFPVYRENTKKLFLPKYYGLEHFGVPEQNSLPDGVDCPRLGFAGGIRKEQELPVRCYLEAVNDPLRMGGIISLPCGGGKCLAKDTPVLMYSGAVKAVQHIRPGELLMGDDSMPRMVMTVCSGVERMIAVVPEVGELYVVNESHILSLLNRVTGEIVDIGVLEYMRLPVHTQKQLVVYRARIEFPPIFVLDPYAFGCQLQSYDFIPPCYLLNQTSVRERLVKGVYDKYGERKVHEGSYVIHFLNKPKLIKDFLFLVRSLGYPASAGYKCVTVYPMNKPIPIVVNMLETDTYYGFEIDGNHRFVLGDFTVTHNTVVSLYLASVFKKKTLVVCHKEFLGNQWKERIEQFLPQATIGRIKQDKIQIEDKDIVIASLQSLAMKDYPSHLFQDFGFVICDECHHLSAEIFSQALPKITCRRMLGLSATLARKDGLSRVFEWYLGKPVYEVKREDKQLQVLVKRFYDPNPEYSAEKKLFNGKLNFAKMINNVCEFMPRNHLIIQVLQECLAKEPARNTLILSERRGHLEILEQLLLQYGYTSIGYYVGGMKQQDLDESATKSIILATFQLASEGMDIPSLNTLILASPVSSIEQSIGRIQRQKACDRVCTPLVIDVLDEFSIFEKQGYKRLRFYRDHGYDVLDKAAVRPNEEVKYRFVEDPDDV